MKKPYLGFKVSPLSAAISLAILGSPASHALVDPCTVDTITVDSVSSSVDSTDGVTTLREAVNNIDNRTDSCSKGDIITFDSSLDNQTIYLNSAVYLDGSKIVSIQTPDSVDIILAPSESNTTSPLLSINEGAQVEIDGLVFDGQSIKRANSLIEVSGTGSSLSVNNSEIKNNVSTGAGSALNVLSASEVSISNTTLSGNTSLNGGAVLANTADVTIKDSVFSNNTSNYAPESTQQSVRGGAIYFYDGGSSKTLTITGTEFNSNSVQPGSGYSSYAKGGAVAVNGQTGTTVTVSDSTFSENSAGPSDYISRGGALNIEGGGGDYTIENSLFDGNTSDPDSYYGYGGAISNDNSSANVTIVNTTLKNNSAFYGGAVNQDVTNESSMAIIQSTISGNNGYRGGAFYMNDNGAAITVRQSTVTQNNASNQGDVLHGPSEYSMTINCNHSAIGDNGDGSSSTVDFPDDLSGLTINNNNCYINDDLNLAALNIDNVHLPQDGSPLIDAGDSEYSPYDDTDQRGASRVVGSAIDIGSVEKNDAPSAMESTIKITVSSGDNGSFNLVALASITDDEGSIIFDTDLGDTVDGISVTAAGVLSIDADQGLTEAIPDDGFYGFELSYSDDVNDSQILTVQLYGQDTDGDGIADYNDSYPNDYDNDGVDDADDAFPQDASETLDTDADGAGNNADSDDDGDGVSDDEDAFPLDASETTDTDGDGAGNNADSDDDGDGVNDDEDALPLDASETTDTDGDGTGNNADTDDDGDGVSDDEDAFPLDNSETIDTDGDGIGNNADKDDDGDGVSDDKDAFPLDETQSQGSSGSGGGSLFWLNFLFIPLLLLRRRIGR